MRKIDVHVVGGECRKHADRIFIVNSPVILVKIRDEHGNLLVDRECLMLSRGLRRECEGEAKIVEIVECERACREEELVFFIMESRLDRSRIGRYGVVPLPGEQDGC